VLSVVLLVTIRCDGNVLHASGGRKRLPYFVLMAVLWSLRNRNVQNILQMACLSLIHNKKEDIVKTIA
jgi:hypothetical protein